MRYVVKPQAKLTTGYCVICSTQCDNKCGTDCTGHCQSRA